MPQYTPVIYFYICQLCCCCWASSLVGLEWSCLQDFSWPQISTSLLKSTLSRAEQPSKLCWYFIIVVQNVWLQALLHLHPLLSKSSLLLAWGCERERPPQPLLSCSLYLPLYFFPFMWVQLYLLGETTWVNGSVRPPEWIKVAFNYLHHWPYEAG